MKLAGTSHLYPRPLRTLTSLDLAAESGQVVKRLDARKEEIGAALYGRESGQALYFSSDWPFRNSYVVAAVLSGIVPIDVEIGGAALLALSR